MSNIDKQRIRGVETLEAHGWRWNGVEWLHHAPKHSVVAEADIMHGILMDRAEALAGAAEGSDEEAELEEIWPPTGQPLERGVVDSLSEAQAAFRSGWDRWAKRNNLPNDPADPANDIWPKSLGRRS